MERPPRECRCPSLRGWPPARDAVPALPPVLPQRRTGSEDSSTQQPRLTGAAASPRAGGSPKRRLGEAAPGVLVKPEPKGTPGPAVLPVSTVPSGLPVYGEPGGLAGKGQGGWRKRVQRPDPRPSPCAPGSGRGPPGAAWARGWLSAGAQHPPPSSLAPFPSTSPRPPLGLSSHSPARPHFSGFELILSTPLSPCCQFSIPRPPRRSRRREAAAAAAGGTGGSTEPPGPADGHGVNRSIASRSTGVRGALGLRPGRAAAGRKQQRLGEAPSSTKKPERAPLVLGSEPGGKGPR